MLIVFGGRDAAGSAMADAWLFNLAERTWRQVDASGPSTRFGHAIATDQENRRLYLFGGQSADEFFNDTWAFDFESETWTLVNDGSGTAPSSRYGLSAVLDGAGRLMVSHGFTFEGRFDDTWAFEFESATWSDISPDAGEPRPLKRCLHEMA